MSKLQELINHLCPCGVHYSKLVEVANVLYGFPFNSKEFTEDSNFIPLIRIRDVKPAKASTFYSGEYSEDYIIHRGDILVGMDGNFNLEKWNDRDGLLNQRVCKIYSKNENIILNGFLYHLLGPLFKAIEDELHSGTVIHLSAARINKLTIPVPPIEVQEEIVRILDTFSAHAAELQAELQARKEQYEYYRNLLLTFNPSACGCGTDGEQKINNVTTWGGHSYKIIWKTMEEVFEMRNGYTPSKNNPLFWEGGSIPWFRMEDIRDNGRILSDAIQHITPAAIKGKGLFEANSFILATTATIGEHALLIADSLANQQFTNLKVRKSLSDKFLTKFIYYYMFIVDEFCKNNTNVSGFASVDMGKLKRMPFPIPPIELQEKIVAILDRFETLVNDLTEGLPAEIAAVKEQYEYYRNKLLTFKNLTA